MHVSLRLLEKAIAIARREAEALAADDENTLETLCGERAILMRDAWEERAGCDPVLFMDALERLRAMQEDLTRRAQTAANYLSDELKDIRREGTRISGYRKATSGMDTPLYVSRQG